MRFLLVNNHCISDPIAGVTQSLRTIVEWLVDAGHECQVLTTARFESAVTFSIEEHLAQHGAAVPPRDADARPGRRPIVRYAVGKVPVTLVLTRHNDERRPDRGEAAQYLSVLETLFREFAPEVLIAANGHPMIFEALRNARRRGVTTAYAVRGYGYDRRSYFDDVNHVFTCSAFLTGVYRKQIGLVSTPLEPPLDWSTVVAPVESRAFVTFVNPSPHKGLFLFARLADMLGSRRPDIPMLVVQSGRSGGGLNAIPGIDFSRYPQIMAAPPVQTPREYFALTRILLVPSVWEEPFGRVAAEAMVNGIPPIVSNRGALPDVIARDGERGGVVCDVPEWMTPDSTRVPTEVEIEPWFRSVCELWDNARFYETLAADGQAIAGACYSEQVARARHLEYLTSLERGATPFATSPISPP